MFAWLPLNEIWFLLLGVLLVGYAVLDGFDLGVGILHPFVTRGDKDKRILMNAIGPVWDGNEVWLVTFGGAMFAAFPNTYATVFSAFYTAFMMLLCGLIFRAVSMEFRSKQPHAWWRLFWDAAFFLSSLLLSLLFGVAVGNAMQSIKIDAAGHYVGSFFDFLNPFALLTGLLVVSLFAMHGGIYLIFKTEGELRRRISRAIWFSYAAFVLLFLVVTGYANLFIPTATANIRAYPITWLIPLLNVAAILLIPYALAKKRPGLAFISSSLSITFFVALFALGMAPNMVHSSLNSEWSLNIYNAAASPKTLGIMLLIALIGMPLVLTYTIVIYRVFRGKVKLTAESY